MSTYRPPPQEGFTYAWNIFSRPWLRTASPRPQPIPWGQLELDHPRQNRKNNSWNRSNRANSQIYSSPDGVGEREIFNHSTFSSHNRSTYLSSKARRRLLSDQGRKHNSRRQRPFYPRRTFWPKRMGQQYWDDDKINFYGSQDIPVTSENDSWRTLLIPQTGTLYDPTDGQFYHWDGTKLCREPWTGSESVQSSGSECHDVSMILCRHELRRLFPEEDTEDKGVYSSDDDSSTHSMENGKKEVHSYMAFHRNLMRRRDELLLS